MKCGRISGLRFLKKLGLAVLACLCLAGTFFISPATVSAAPTSVERALDYLAAHQSATGGFSSSGDQGQGVTTWIVMAIAAAGQNPGSWTTSTGKDPVSYLRDLDVIEEAETGEGANNSASFYSRLILAFAAAGRPDLVREAGLPRVDLVEQLLTYQSPETGNFALSKTDFTLADVSTTIWAIMALAAAGDTSEAIDRATEWLKQAQGEDGGYGWQTGAMKDVDDTAAVVMALRAAGVPADDPAIQGCLNFIRSYQISDGGFRSWMSSASSSESTSWVLGALAAVGEDAANWRTSGGATPVSYLESLQQPSGLFAHSLKTDGDAIVSIPLLGTAYAVIALSGQSYPVAPGEQAPRPVYAPNLGVVSPSPEATLRDGLITIEANYSDEGTGIGTGSLIVTLDGVDVTDEAAVEDDRLVVTLGSVPQGEHSLTVRVGDRAGNVSSVTVPFYMAAYESTSTTTSTLTTSSSSTTTTLGGGSATTSSTQGSSGGSSTTTTGTATATTTDGNLSVASGTGGTSVATGSAGLSSTEEDVNVDVSAAVVADSAPAGEAGGVAYQEELSGYRVSDSLSTASAGAIKDFDAPADTGRAAWAGGLVGGLMVLLGAGASLSHGIRLRDERRLQRVVGLSIAAGRRAASHYGGRDE